MAALLRVFRVLLKITRLLREASFAEGARRLATTTIKSIPALASVAALMILMYFVYAVLGVGLFYNVEYKEYINSHANFQDFQSAFMTLFRATTGESWNGLMHDVARRGCLKVDGDASGAAQQDGHN